MHGAPTAPSVTACHPHKSHDGSLQIRHPESQVFASLGKPPGGFSFCCPAHPSRHKLAVFTELC